MCDSGNIKGSITVFTGMTLMMILSIFFSLLEVVHYASLKKDAGMVSDIAIESMFGDYNRMLWDEYDVLGIDLAYGGDELLLPKAEERMDEYVTYNLSPSDNSAAGNHLEMSGSSGITTYGVLTDDHGVPFMKACAKSVMYGLPADVLGTLKENTDTAREEELKDTNIEDVLNGGMDALNSGSDDEKDAETESVPESFDTSSGGLSEADAHAAGNPIELISEWRKKGILHQVVPVGMSVSEKVFKEKSPPSKRTNEKGNLNSHLHIGVTERLLFQHYLKGHMSAYTSEKTGRCLSYELEYILNAKDSDSENLKKTAKKLLGIRTGMNMTSLMNDPVKVAQAHSVALALAGVTANPVIIKAVEAAVITAWSYVESVLDVRALLAGDKIALHKTNAQWTSDVMHLSELLTQGAKAVSCEDGFNYQDYLIAMIILVSENKVAMRTMDVIEANMHLNEDYRRVRLDRFCYQSSVTYEYVGGPVFGTLVTLGDVPGAYDFAEERTMYYTK